MSGNANVATYLMNLISNSGTTEIRLEAIRSLSRFVDNSSVATYLTNLISNSGTTEIRLEAIRALGGRAVE